MTDLEVEAELAAVQRRTGQVGAAAAMQNQGIDVDDVRAALRQRMELARLVAVRGSDVLAAGEVETAFQTHPERYQLGGGVQVKPYLARVPLQAAAAVQDKAHAGAVAFAAAVATTDPESLPLDSRLESLQPFVVQQNELEPALLAALGPLHVGQWTGTVRTKVG